MTLKTNHQETLCQVNLVFRDRLHLTPCRKARVSVRITEENLGAHPLYNNVSSPFIIERRVLLILAVKTPVQPGPEFLVCRISALAITQGSYYTCRRSNRNCLRLRFKLSGSEALTAIIRNNRAPTNSEAEKLNTDMHVPLCSLREATGATMILCSGPAITHDRMSVRHVDKVREVLCGVKILGNEPEIDLNLGKYRIRNFYRHSFDFSRSSLNDRSAFRRLLPALLIARTYVSFGRTTHLQI